MGGIFGVISKRNCALELFYGVDYHSHLGTRRGGMATYGREGFNRAIHNIENSPFRTKFERDVQEMEGNMGIASISDYEPQPLLIQSHLGSFAIATVGKINNFDELLHEVFAKGNTHFQEMSSGQVNATELVASLICKKDSIPEGIRYVQEIVDGSMTLLLMTREVEAIIAQDSCYINALLWKSPKLYPSNTFLKRDDTIHTLTKRDGFDIM